MKNIDTNEFPGLWIPNDILKLDLKFDEKAILAIIAFYTSKGDRHACYLTNQKLSQITGIPYYAIRDRIKPTLLEKGYIASNGGIKTISTLYSAGNYTPENSKPADVVKSTMGYSEKNDTKTTRNLYRQTTTVKNNELSLNDDRVSSNDDSVFVSSNDDRGCSETTIQNKEENKEINKEEKNTYNISTFIGDARGQAFTHVKSDPGDAYTPTMECLIDQYEDNGDDLPLLQYLDDHPDETVYERIAEAMEDNEEQLKGLKRYWDGIQNGITATRYTDDRPKAVHEGDCSWLPD